MNKEIRLLLALIVMVLLILGLAACGAEDLNSSNASLTGTWTLRTYNGMATSANVQLILNSNATHKWLETGASLTCETTGTYSYAASKVAFVDTATSNVLGCDEVTLNEQYVYGYSKSGSALELTSPGLIYTFSK